MCEYPCFAFHQGRLLVSESEGDLVLPSVRQLRRIGVQVALAEPLGLDGTGAKMLDLGEELDTPKGFTLVGLRRVLLSQSAEVARLAGRAAQLIEWRRTHRFCGVCGGPTLLSKSEPAMVCEVCEHPFYPRVTPAVIVSITRDDEILLARGHHLPEGFFSVLAGFVEAGESLEEAVMREIKEEVSIDLRDLHYFGSQPWPFPHSLMVAFTAEYAGGDLCPDPKEIAHAEWFSVDRLPAVPPRLSIARELIDDFVRRCGRDPSDLEEWGPR